MSESSYQFDGESDNSIKRPYKRVKSQEKQNLFQEVFVNHMKITKAARKLGLNLSTAKFLIKKYRKQHNISKRIKQTTSLVQQNSIERTSLAPQIQQNNPIFYYIYNTNNINSQNMQGNQWIFPLYYPFQ